MSGLQVQNALKATLAAGINATTTTITIADAATVPAKGPFFLSIFNATDYADPADDPNYERVFVPSSFTSSTTISNVVRGADGTTGSSHEIPNKTYRAIVAAGAAEINYQNAGLDLRDFTGRENDGTTDDSGGLQDAVNFIIGPNKIKLPSGTTILDTNTLIDEDNVLIEGCGPGSVLQCDASISEILSLQACSRVKLRDFTILNNGATTAIGYDQAVTATTQLDIELENILIRNTVTNGNGIVFANRDDPTNILRRVRFRNVQIIDEQAGTPTAGTGIIVSAGDGINAELEIDGLLTEGFFDGLNLNSDAGRWQQSRFNNLHLKDAERYGARFYHADGVLTNSIFEGNDAGAYLDSGANNDKWLVSNCQFINNRVVGAFTEEWRECVLKGCMFRDNKYGLWMGSGQHCVISDCTMADNSEWGMNTDSGESLTDTGRSTFTISVDTQGHSNVIRGCNISHNGENGLEIKGWIGTNIIDGNYIARNGTNNPTASTSGVADILIDDDSETSPRNTGQVSITNNVMGNPSAIVSDGKTQYGIRAISGSHGDLIIRGNTIQQCEDALDIPSGIAHIEGNSFILCNDITLGTIAHGNQTYRNNRVREGTLQGGQWDEGGIRRMYAEKTYDPTNLADGATDTETITVTGAAVGDLVTASHSQLAVGGVIVAGAVTSADTVTVTIHNENGGVQNIASGTLRVTVEKRDHP